ncbi:MAG TPA: LytTR family DNA-binding domain-containing protein [Puia sp.]|nr:LytTR family DNA-binding domain-containing protein [Puia sp.]
MTKNIKCLILDDEPLAVDVIENYLKRLPNIESFKSNNAVDAFQIMQQEKIDLIFLDIEMPLMTGLDFLKTMKAPPAIVIITAYRDYAVEGYEHDALDYLVKPVSFPRFMKAFEKVLRYLQTANASAEDAEPGKRHLFLKVSGKFVKIAIDEILYVESLKDYIKVVTPGNFWISYQTLTSITEKLPEDRFMRIHRSFTIAIDKVSAVEGGCVAIGGKLIPFSRDLRQEVVKRIRGGSSSS